MYVKCGVLKDAARLFDEMPVRDTISWNTMISGQLSLGLEFGFQLFKERQDVGMHRFDQATLTTVLSVCDAQDHHRVTEMVHCLVVSHGYGQGIGTPQQFDIFGCVVSMFWSKCLTRRVPG
ncbi:hypothetical protein QQ045_026013 [Rhodiola kirilowii]